MRLISASLILLLLTAACESKQAEHTSKDEDKKNDRNVGADAEPEDGHTPNKAGCLTAANCPAPDTSGDGDAETPSLEQEWQTFCAELARGLVCTEEYAPHTCKLGSYDAQAENPCFAKNALKKKVCDASAFTLKMADISCGPTLADNNSSNNPSNNPSNNASSNAAVTLWKTSCDGRNSIMCTADYKPSICTLGEWSGAGSNSCHARKAFLDKACPVFASADQAKHAETYKLDSIRCMGAIQ